MFIGGGINLCLPVILVDRTVHEFLFCCNLMQVRL